MPCPCGSGSAYSACCKRFHDGKRPKRAIDLVRSRYAAYVLNLPDYIIKTTHPTSPSYFADKALLREKLSEFSQETQFEGLEILDAKEEGQAAMVTFIAHLSQDGRDATFTERSYFLKVDEKWLYQRGKLAEGHAPNLVVSGQIRLLPLAYYGDPILRKKAEPVDKITDDLRALAQEMIETMDGCDGIGLAAPQIHHSIRMFVIRPPGEGKATVLINPTISEPSEETCVVDEGCLSIPTINGDVVRSREITVVYTTLEGKHVEERCGGWKARVILHEYDHIEGILFIDRMKEEERRELEPFLEHLHRRIHDGTEL